MRAIILVGVLASLAGSALAADKTYQVTGPVVENTADAISVMKGKDKWTLGKDGGTKAPADIKVGDKVTVYYRMTATEIDAAAKKK